MSVLSVLSVMPLTLTNCYDRASRAAVALIKLLIRVVFPTASLTSTLFIHAIVAIGMRFAFSLSDLLVHSFLLNCNRIRGLPYMSALTAVASVCCNWDPPFHVIPVICHLGED